MARKQHDLELYAKILLKNQEQKLKRRATIQIGEQTTQSMVVIPSSLLSY